MNCILSLRFEKPIIIFPPLKLSCSCPTQEAITAKEERRRQEREQHQKERESHRYVLCSERGGGEHGAGTETVVVGA